jgi:hypothetical protein
MIGKTSARVGVSGSRVPAVLDSPSFWENTKQKAMKFYKRCYKVQEGWEKEFDGKYSPENFEALKDYATELHTNFDFVRKAAAKACKKPTPRNLRRYLANLEKADKEMNSVYGDFRVRDHSYLGKILFWGSLIPASIISTASIFKPELLPVALPLDLINLMSICASEEPCGYQYDLADKHREKFEAGNPEFIKMLKNYDITPKKVFKYMRKSCKGDALKPSEGYNAP